MQTADTPESERQRRARWSITGNKRLGSKPRSKRPCDKPGSVGLANKQQTSTRPADICKCGNLSSSEHDVTADRPTEDTRPADRPTDRQKSINFDNTDGQTGAVAKDSDSDEGPASPMQPKTAAGPPTAARSIYTHNTRTKISHT